jgi:hypothetical protein
VERPARLELDRVELRVGGLDGLRDGVARFGGLGVVLDEPGEQGVDHLAAAGLVRVAGNQRVLGLGRVDADRGVGLLATGPTAAGAAARPTARAREQRDGDRDGETGGKSEVRVRTVAVSLITVRRSKITNRLLPPIY